MLSTQDNDILCRVGPGTPMGDLMREYWIPALMSSGRPGYGLSSADRRAAAPVPWLMKPPGVVQPDPEDPRTAETRERPDAAEAGPSRLRGGRRLLDDAGHIGEAPLRRGAEELERDVPGLPGRPAGPRNRKRSDCLLHRVLLRLGDIEGDEQAQHQPASPSSHSRSRLRA